MSFERQSIDANPKVLVVVVNWNDPDSTRRCIQSLVQSDYSNMRVLVVDNGSNPELYARLQADQPGMEILRSEVNLGFPGGANVGLRYVLTQEADYALVLNNDTIIDPKMVSQLVQAAEANPNAGLVGPVIYYLDHPDKVWFSGERFPFGLYLFRRSLRLAPSSKAVEQVDFISGCAVLIPRPVLENIGLFPSEYFMYYDDIDLSVRVKSAGKSLLCVTGARMWHAVSISYGGPDSPVKQYFQAKSSFIFYRKYSKGLRLWINILLHFVHASLTVLKALFLGKLKVRSIGMFLKGMLEGWRQPLIEERKSG